MKVLWTHAVSGDAARQLTPPPGVELVIETDRARALEMKDWPQVLVDGGPPEELLDGAALQQVIVPYAGLGGRLRSYLLKRPHLKVQNSHFNDGMVAQHAVSLVLAVASRIPATDSALRRGDWGPAEKDTDGLGVYLRGKDCLLLGYGSIARAAAPALAAQAPQQVEKNVDAPAFDDMLKMAFNRVNDLQKTTSDLQSGYERGVPGIDLTEVMIASQKSSVAFQAMTQVRNKMISAYEDIMKMPI